MIQKQEERPHTVADINRVDIDGNSPSAYGRIAHAASIVETRIAALEAADDVPGAGLRAPLWRSGPAFEVHVWSGLKAMMDDPASRLALRQVVALGESANVVVFVHE